MNQNFIDSPTEEGQTLELSETEYHEFLSNERRRVAFNILETRETPVELMELATAVGTREVEDDVPDAGYVERVAITLHHNHLPRMDQLGFIDYDPATKRITIEE